MFTRHCLIVLVFAGETDEVQWWRKSTVGGATNIKPRAMKQAFF